MEMQNRMTNVLPSAVRPVQFLPWVCLTLELLWECCLPPACDTHSAGNLQLFHPDTGQDRGWGLICYPARTVRLHPARWAGCLWSGLGRTMEILPVFPLFSTLYLLIPCSSWGVLALLSRRCRTTTFYGTYYLFNIKIYYFLILKFSLLVLICLWVFCICPMKYRIKQTSLSTAQIW